MWKRGREEGDTGRSRVLLVRAATLALCAGLAACGNVPDGAGIILEKAAVASPPIVTSAGGRALSLVQSAQILKNAGASAQFIDHLAFEQAIAETPLTDGNSTRVLVDGADTFKAMFQLMRGARRSIDLESFIFEDVSDGRATLGDLLVRKRRQGVTVNVMYDSFGSGSTPPEFFERLKKAHINIVQFNPIDPLEAKKLWSPNHRDHRKILVVDGAVAITGGINMSSTYESGGSGHSGAPKDLKDAYWHDTDLEIRGPAARHLQQLFLDHWASQKGPALPREKFASAPPPSAGHELVRVIGSAAGKDVPHYYVTLLDAVRHAESRIWLTAAYFVPTDEQRYALIAAAKRGVDVRILVPDKGDSALSTLMQHSNYGALLKAGIRIWETHNEVLHSKTVIVDGVWTVVGSSNFDHRSVIFNDEADVVVVGRGTGGELERNFEKDLATAHEVTKRKWSHRAPIKRLREELAPLYLAVMKSNL